jgi:hypothetical protein
MRNAAPHQLIQPRLELANQTEGIFVLCNDLIITFGPLRGMTMQVRQT